MDAIQETLFPDVDFDGTSTSFRKTSVLRPQNVDDRIGFDAVVCNGILFRPE
jgi:hypothetical protein